VEKKMKHILITAAYFLLVSSQIVFAQNTGNTSIATQAGARSTPNAQQLNEAQAMIGQYIVQYHNNSGLEGRKVLEHVHALGLDITADNVKITRSLLSSTMKSDEKVVLTRILGSLYTHNNKTGMNSEITQDLKGVIYSDQKEVARAGVLAYSRLGYFTDSGEVLLHAKNSGIIDTDEYYGEIAYLVPYAPANDQINLVTKIKGANNQYAMEILAFSTQDSEIRTKVDAEAKKIVLSSLEANEPGFAQAPKEFSLIDAVRYSTWLQSIATLSSATSNVKYEDVVLAHLNNFNTDPRKIMAFLMSSDGKTLIQKIGKGGSLDSALERISLYLKQIPPSIIMEEVVQDITASINSVKG
jgi:hypothetical protein